MAENTQIDENKKPNQAMNEGVKNPLNVPRKDQPDPNAKYDQGSEEEDTEEKADDFNKRKVS